ncbi:MAG: RNA polymerase sigma-70 factor [Tannerellaceae bacterium]|nr:RNA polymerase sigma-70 factor [Tannerellaceae bacterium]
MRDESIDIHKIVSGNPGAFNRFVNIYTSPLLKYAYGIIENKESAEEIVSDVFLEVWKNREQLHTIENIKSWLFVITYRKAISYLRKESGKTAVSFEEIDHFMMAPILSPDEEMISKEKIEQINQAIEKLPPKCKHVFYLAKIERMPYKEIADILNISVKTINNHIAYALEAISGYLNISEKK